jgi:hypothetical protein
MAGPLQLMMSFTADGQLDPALQQQRDEMHGISSEEVSRVAMERVGVGSCKQAAHAQPAESAIALALSGMLVELTSFTLAREIMVSLYLLVSNTQCVCSANLQYMYMHAGWALHALSSLTSTTSKPTIAPNPKPFLIYHVFLWMCTADPQLAYGHARGA